MSKSTIDKTKQTRRTTYNWEGVEVAGSALRFWGFLGRIHLFFCKDKLEAR
jgi:hypothetical protein